ncbi:MAG: VanZ family protein [Candidatus Roizmanbacteria bacterium]|nr:VanZ family protein [Candidatus Roizmanbacteria bacterium]
MRKKMDIFYYWFPPAAWMGVIFYMSSQRSISITSHVTTDFVTFKTLHMVEYAFLFFFFFRAFQSLKYLKPNINALCSFCLTMFYSLTDEFHQLYIATRQGRFRDVLFDVVGILVMYVIIKKVRLIQKLL